MKTNTLRRVIYGLALLTGLSACEEEQLENQILTEAEMEATIEAPISASVAFEGTSEDETRTYIDEHENYASGVGTLWRPKEVIGVYGTGMTNAKFTGTNTKNAGSVSFSGSLLGSPKYAYYPYSENNKGVKQTAVKGNMPNAQDFNQTTKDIVGDYRAGIIDSRGWFSSTFTFKRLVSILKFTVDATGSALEGDRIKTIAFKVDNNRQLAGNFTINLTTQEIDLGAFEEGDDSLTLICTDNPTLGNGVSYRGYMTSLPAMEIGDNIKFIITTDKHVAQFTRASKAAFKANELYTYPLTLKNFPDMVVTEIEQEDNMPGVTPKLNSIKFTAALNPGKILTRTLKFNSTSYKPAGTEDKNFEANCTIDTVNKKVSLFLPYLNNRKLVPTFEIPEGTQWLLENGEEVISGETEVDFTQHKQIVIMNSVGEEVVYEVELTNTGLPVVVINQQSGNMVSTESGDIQKASNTWYAATGTKWIPKNGEWSMVEGQDDFMVYNADGTPAICNKSNATLDEPVLASTRVRGNISQQMPKKSFAVKLDKKTGIFMNDSDPDNDLPAHKRWVLLANWKDRTLMRNEVAFGLADVFKQTFPNDGLAWNPSGQHVELVYNDVYVGNYYLCEQIKIDENRLAINEPFDAGDEKNPYNNTPESYGYLLECDDAYDEQWKFLTKMYIPFLFKDDGNDDMLKYAQTLVRGVEENLSGGKYSTAYNTMEKTSFVDFMLLQELMMNGEMKHPKSCYMYINNGKLYAGPIWDFDWNTLPNSGYSEEKFDYTSLMITKASVKTSNSYPSSTNTSDANYIWYSLLTKDAEFKKLVAERWNKVKGALQNYAASIPAMEEKLRKSEEENWNIWKLDHDGLGNSKMRTGLYGLGGSTYYKGRSTCGYCGDENMTFQASLENLSMNLTTRINGINTYITNNKWSTGSSTSGGSTSGGSSWWPWRN